MKILLIAILVSTSLISGCPTTKPGGSGNPALSTKPELTEAQERENCNVSCQKMTDVERIEEEGLKTIVRRNFAPVAAVGNGSPT